MRAWMWLLLPAVAAGCGRTGLLLGEPGEGDATPNAGAGGAVTGGSGGQMSGGASGAEGGYGAWAGSGGSGGVNDAGVGGIGGAGGSVVDAGVDGATAEPWMNCWGAKCMTKDPGGYFLMKVFVGQEGCELCAPYCKTGDSACPDPADLTDDCDSCRNLVFLYNESVGYTGWYSELQDWWNCLATCPEPPDEYTWPYGTWGCAADPSSDQDAAVTCGCPDTPPNGGACTQLGLTCVWGPTFCQCDQLKAQWKCRTGPHEPAHG